MSARMEVEALERTEIFKSIASKLRPTAVISCSMRSVVSAERGRPIIQVLELITDEMVDDMCVKMRMAGAPGPNSLKARLFKAARTESLMAPRSMLLRTAGLMHSCGKELMDFGCGGLMTLARAP
ncbi:hypothetical protein NDU88_001087 [Pleurodeles waltl]|uniref:Uncharacterized protein n=1 Tax=Pleurodeles waltl TaxID=8319 RepID=A0AAV7W0F8_PLEWA|nr:hypothetical protein NDU88_001087 [Pleurodeles waltl]